MPWAFVRPADPSVLKTRPLLDLGTGDGQTLAALAPKGFSVGIDRKVELLRPGGVNAEAGRLPFMDRSFATVLAADLFHHLDDAELGAVLAEIRRVMRPGGRLVGWWYEHTSDRSPDAPRHPRGLEAFAALASAKGLRVQELELVAEIPSSATVGVVATR